MVQLYKRKGGEVLVNTETFGTQANANVAVLAGGGFVVTWTDGSLLGGDSSGFGIKAQLFDVNGDKVGSEFLVNTTTVNNQNSSVVSVLPSGRFAIIWTDASVTGGDTSSNAIRGQIFEANGTPVGSEFLVNTATTGSQSGAAITELSGGGFVVSWTDASGVGGDNSGSGIKAQIFDASAVKVGGEILVNTEITGSQGQSSVIAFGTGFAAAWQGATTSSGGITSSSVRLQFFDSAGAKVGTEQIVNASNDGNFANPNISALATGFIVTWAQQDQPSFPGFATTFDVRAQMYDANGARLGAEFVVNTTTSGSQTAADVDMLPGGFFLVTWQSSSISNVEFNIYGQVFDSTGAKVGTEFVVNSTTDGSQVGARVDVLPSGDIVILWQDSSGDQDESGSGVKMQILTLETGAPTDISLSASSISETAREDTPLITLSTTGALNSSFTYELLSDSTGGAFRIDGDRLVVADSSLLDFETATQVEIRIRTTDLNGHSYEETIQLDIADEPETGYGATGSEFLVNTTTAQNQSEPFLTPLTSGGWLAAWIEWPIGGGDTVTKGQIYDENGDPVGGELTLGDVSAAAGVPGGGFVTATVAPDAAGDGIFLQFYDSAGTATGGAFQANTTTAGNQTQPAVTSLAFGGFVVTWSDSGSGAGAIATVRAQIFDVEGTKVGGEFVVPPAGGGSPDVTALAGGGFVVAWANGGIQAQIFTATGLRHGPPLIMNNSDSSDPHVTALADGGFVVVWSGPAAGHFFAIGAQIFDANGNMVGDQILVLDDNPQQVFSLDVAPLHWGGFVVTWAGEDSAAPSDAGIRAQVYDGSGAPLGDQLVVADATGSQIHPDVIVLPSGDFVIAWSDFGAADGDGAAVRARTFSISPAVPTAGPDVLDGTPNADTIDGLAGNDLIHGLGDNDVLYGGADNDQLFGDDGNDTLDGGTGSDRLEGGTGDDFYYVDSAADLVVEAAGQGNDRVFASASYTLAAGASVELLTTDFNAGTNAINLTGNELDNTIYGNDGANILDGGAGIDTLVGRLGDDFYYVDNAGDVVIETAGQGNDRIFAGASYTLAAGLSVELFTTDFNPGTAAINLTGNELANVIYGNDGTNILDGAGGADVLVGRSGDDFYYVDNATDLVLETAGQGNDRVFASVSYTLAAGQAVELLTTDFNPGTAAINLSGNELANTIFGNDGANILDGRAGADTLVGRLGDDWYFIDNVGDAIVESAGQGNDRVFAGVSYTLAAGVSVELLTTDFNAGTGAINLTGNELANTIFGNDGANILNGGGGADTLVGRLGDDVYFVDNAGDTIIETAGQGNDRVSASLSYALAAGVDVETLGTDFSPGTAAINLTGNELANRIEGNNGSNILDGRGGADTLVGSGGDDFYHVDNGGDVVVEGASEGSDRIFAAVSYTLGAGSSVELLTTDFNAGTGAINLTGNELANTIYGNDGANVLDGKAGNDLLIGFAGADSFAFTTALGANNVDTIIDFVSGSDKLQLDDAIFTQLGAPGALNANAFATGSAAGDADDRIIYNSATGQLFYDADGNGVGAAVLFATLNGHPALAASDILVI